MADFQALMQAFGNRKTRFASRVLVGLFPHQERTVLQELSEGFERLRVARFVHSDGFVSAPGRLFSEIVEASGKIRASGKAVLLTGLDGYLSIIGSDNRRECFLNLLRLAERSGSDATVTLLRHDWPEGREVFDHPRLSQNGDWAVFSPSMAPEVHLKLVPPAMRNRFAEGSVFDGLSSWLEAVEDGIGASDTVVCAGFNGRYPFRVLDNDAVQQSPTDRSFLLNVCHFECNTLSDEAVEWIIENTRETDVAEELLSRFQTDGGAGVADGVLKRTFHLVSPVEKEVFLSLIRTIIPKNGYAGRIIELCSQSPQLFVERYLEPPPELVGSSCAVEWAEERRRAVIAWPDGKETVASAVAKFIDAAKDLPAATIGPWLNLGLPCEEREWLRRVLSGEGEASGKSSLANAYFADQTLGNEALDGYFSEYRRQKAANCVEMNFCRMAATATVPGGIETRANALASLGNDKGVFLLVVDALGAEWIPAIVTFANVRHLRITEHRCVRANCPTSTGFNPVKDEAGSAVAGFEKMDDFDQTIIHANGLHVCDGIYKELTYIRDVVMSKVADLLNTFEKVILTADHGASRLAVLAHESGTDTTLKPGEGGIPTGLAVEDWRYARKPPELAIGDARLAITTSGEWAVIRGYNRFSRQGGTGFEVHGGATLEEMLVPFVTFERGFIQNYDKPMLKSTSKTSSIPGDQIEENEGFDI